MPTIKVAYLGPPSSYTHQAAIDSFGTPGYDLVPQTSIRDIFATVQSSAITFGVVPFENSSNGPVEQTLDLFIDREDEFPAIEICSEVYIGVQHCLLGHVSRCAGQENVGSRESSSDNATPSVSIPFSREPRAKPLSDLAHIERVYSHPQAFGQSEVFLSTYLKSAKRHEASSTSEAAKIASADDTGKTAAIASRLAADIHQLAILAEGIQDVEDNRTRFLVIQNGPTNEEKQMLLPEKLRLTAAIGTCWRSLTNFSVNHETPGALAKALMVFNTHRLNLTSINSRPSRIRPWHYSFLVEFQHSEGLQDSERLDLASKELNSVTEGNKWLGIWVDRSC